MRGFGAELIEFGQDFDEGKEHAAQIAAERHYEIAPSFHRDLVIGVAAYRGGLMLWEPHVRRVSALP
jgi:threonine dehydratase